MNDYYLGFIGAGNMAEAIARGALTAAVLRADQLRAADPSEARRLLFRQELQVQTTADNLAVARDCQVLVLAVKPQMIDAVMATLGPALDGKLLVSIAAGVTIARLARLCPPGTRIVRTMPNTPVLVGRGMVAISPGPSATAADRQLVRDLFAASATVLELPEEKIDAVTALSGSGPAYFFYLTEALIAAGVAVGLTPEEAAVLARTTFAGSAELLTRSDCGPDELRRRVTSPGGTTAAAIASFDRDDFRGLVARAVQSAAARSRELGK